MYDDMKNTNNDIISSTNSEIDVDKLLYKKQQSAGTKKTRTPLEERQLAYQTKLKNMSLEELKKEEEQLEAFKKQRMIETIIATVLLLVAVILIAILTALFLPLAPGLVLGISAGVGAVITAVTGIMDNKNIILQVQKK